MQLHVANRTANADLHNSRTRAPAYLVITALMLLLLGLAGCGNAGENGSDGNSGVGNAADAGEVTDEAEPFKVVDQAWTSSDSGIDDGATHVHWTAVIENPNDDVYGTFPAVVTAAGAALSA